MTVVGDIRYEDEISKTNKGYANIFMYLGKICH